MTGKEALEYDGVIAWSDLSDKDEDELSHLIIDAFVHLAKLRGHSIATELLGCVEGYARGNPEKMIRAIAESRGFGNLL